MFQINDVIFILSIFQQQLGQAVTYASFTIDMHCVILIRLHIKVAFHFYIFLVLIVLDLLLKNL